MREKASRVVMAEIRGGGGRGFPDGRTQASGFPSSALRVIFSTCQCRLSLWARVLQNYFHFIIAFN